MSLERDLARNEASRAGRIVLLAGRGTSSRIVFAALRREFGEVAAIVEEPPSRWALVRRRARRLGVARALGQALFSTVAVPLLSLAFRARKAEIVAAEGLEAEDWGSDVHRVPSVNHESVPAVIRDLDPAVVVVNGTRIIRASVLEHIHCPVINTHAGITPAYRGVHGGYWALAEGRPELVGTTVHRVDEGIDTGDVIEQVHFEVTDRDSFVTYPYLHLAAGLPALIRAVHAAIDGTLEAKPPPEMESKLRYHPTLWGYVRTWLARGVK